MRLFVIGLALATAGSVLAQAPVEQASPPSPVPLQQQSALPRTPPQRQRIRQAGPSATTAASAKAANVPPDTPVVTLDGICKERQAKSPSL
jgi:hypothetical protein